MRRCTFEMMRFFKGVPATRLLEALLALGFLAMVLRYAWVTEDAFITLRTIDNAVHGHGLRWNIDERVQSFTHPLWLLLILPIYAITQEGYFTLLILSAVVSAAGFYLLMRWIASSNWQRCWISGVLLSSAAFVQFSTSGLENPLTHVLLIVFLGFYVRASPSPRALTLSALLAALLAMTRMDAALLVAPALVHTAECVRRQSGTRVTLRSALLGLLPLLVWESFSVIYYGFPLPNTAYAKLGTGLPRHTLFIQGLLYLKSNLTREPFTLSALALFTTLAICVPLSGRRRRKAPTRNVTSPLLALGVLLYVAYLTLIGGDFMLGRLLTAPLLVAVVAAAAALPAKPNMAALVLAAPLLATALLSPRSPWAFETREKSVFDAHLISDERMFFNRYNSLLSIKRGMRVDDNPWAREGRRIGHSKAEVVVRPNIGLIGFFSGPDVHIIDSLALADPLLARLPAAKHPWWRVGHFFRHVPDGYAASLKEGRVLISDPALALYYAHLRHVVSGRLWSVERWRDIAKFNLGMYDHLIDVTRHRYHEAVDVSASTVAPRSESMRSPTTFSTHGVRVHFDSPQHALRVALHLSPARGAQLRCLDHGRVIAKTLLMPTSQSNMPAVIALPSACKRGYRSLHLLPQGNGSGSLKSLSLLR